MTVIEIYQIFKTIASSYPIQSNDYETLQSFAVLDDPAMLNTANLGKSKIYAANDFNKSLLFNRKWQEGAYDLNDIGFDFPLLSVFQTKFNSLDLNRVTYEIPIYVIGKDEIESDNITFEQMDTILETMLFNVLRQFEGFVKYEGNWVHESTLTQFEISKCTETVIQAFKNRKALTFERERVGVQKLSSVYCTLNIQISKCDFLDFVYV
jgi:hypothetical protein